MSTNNCPQTTVHKQLFANCPPAILSSLTLVNYRASQPKKFSMDTISIQLSIFPPGVYSEMIEAPFGLEVTALPISSSFCQPMSSSFCQPMLSSFCQPILSSLCRSCQYCLLSDGPFNVIFFLTALSMLSFFFNRPCQCHLLSYDHVKVVFFLSALPMSVLCSF